MRPVNVRRNRIDTTIEDLDDIDLDRRSSTGSLTGSYDSGAISSDSEGWFDFLKTSYKIFYGKITYRILTYMRPGF